MIEAIASLCVASVVGLLVSGTFCSPFICSGLTMMCTGSLDLDCKLLLGRLRLHAVRSTTQGHRTYGTIVTGCVLPLTL